MKRCLTCDATYPNRFSVCPQDGSKLVESGGWSEGSVIRGKYRIMTKVGQGGMGAVYKASHVTFQELRALKVMNPDLLGDELFVKRFKQEAIIARKLDHPNAVRVDDIDESEDGLLFMVMEYIEGQSLKSLIEDHGPLPAGRTCSIVKQVASALDAAHRLGMVHRDIKPANIVLIKTPQGEQAKVLDFGIAKIKEAHSNDSGMTLTGTGMVMGTPQYMSPEQALGRRGDQLDGRSDLYSLGVVMYQMLTGELPFKTDTTMQLLLAHINTPPRPILEASPDLQISPALARVVMKCLEKDPAMRPATGAALIEEISAAGSILADETIARASGSDMATMIAAPPRVRTGSAPRPSVTAKPSTAMAATATETPPSLEQPVVTAPAPEPKSGWLRAVLAVIAIAVLAAGGAVGFHYYKLRLPARPPIKQSPLPPVSTPPPRSLGTTSPVSAPPSVTVTETPPKPETPANPKPRAPTPTATQTKPPLAKGHPPEKSGTGSITATSQPKAKPPAQPQAANQQVAAVNPPPANSPSPAGNPSFGTLLVFGTPGATISVDDKPAGTVGASGQMTLSNLPTGRHIAQASLSGFSNLASVITLEPSGTAVFNAKFGSSQTITGSQAAPASATPSSPASGTARKGPVAASFPVDYRHGLGWSKGLLAIEGRTVRYQPTNGKDAFTSSLTGISWGSSGGNEFYLRLANGRTYKFRAAAAATILSTLHRATAAP